MLDDLRYIALQSVVKFKLITFLNDVKAYVVPILASSEPSSDYMAYKNIISTFSWI